MQTADSSEAARRPAQIQPDVPGWVEDDATSQPRGTCDQGALTPGASVPLASGLEPDVGPVVCPRGIVRRLEGWLGLGTVGTAPESWSRPANLIDWMIGVLAFSASFGMAREVDAEPFWEAWLRLYRANPPFYYLTYIHCKVVAALIPLTLGYLAIRLRGRRPPSPRLSRHPGFVAATTATVALMVGMALNLAKLYAGLPIRRHHQFPWSYDFYPSVGYVVLGSRLGLAFTGRWRRDRLWMEVPGLLIGATWIATALVEWAGLALGLDVYRF